MYENREQESSQRPTRTEVEETLLGDRLRYTRREVAELAGVPFPYAQRLWRAMGFAEVADDDVAFTEADRVTLERAAGLLRSGLLDEELGVQLARALGQGIGRVAEWQANTLVEQVATPGAAPPDSSVRAAVDAAEHMIPEFQALVVHVWRRQLAASGVRAFAAADSGLAPTRVPLAVGFAELSFACSAAEPGEGQRLEWVEQFEVMASDAVAACGGRIVKTLGEELLFVVDTAAAAGEAALRLTEARVADEPVAVRVGLSYGTVRLRFGDVSGRPVNLASRLTSRAASGSVLVDGEVAAAGELEGYRLDDVDGGSARSLGSVRPSVLRRSGR